MLFTSSIANNAQNLMWDNHINDRFDEHESDRKKLNIINPEP